jgi:hypothetical protein
VAFRYKDYQDHNRWKVMRLAVEEFIRRFLLPGFSGDEHTTRRKATPAGGSSDIKKIRVCLRVGGLAGVRGNGENPLG